MTASNEYVMLASRIRSHAKRLGVAGPDLVLLWFSECDLGSGCPHPGQYPQFYTAGTDKIVRNTASRMGAKIVDASYNHVAKPTSLPLNRCSGCTSLFSLLSGRRTCSMDGARAEMNAPSMRRRNQSAFGDADYRSQLTSQGCTKTCSSVMPGYYPHDAAHEHAAHMLLKELRPIISTSARTNPAMPRASLLGHGLMSQPLLPRIDISKKIFFNHVHKCAGSTFTTFLRTVPGTSWCAPLVAADMVHAASQQGLTEWWFESIPNCSLLALESPSLGEVTSLMGREKESRMVASRDQPLDFYEPQVFTFYRDPYERCRSEWRYEQAVCHPPVGLQNRPKHTRDYCQNWFLPRFGAYNTTVTHQAFVREYCTERLSRDFERHGLDFKGLVRSHRLVFVGLAEDYFASVCLFWYMAGKFPFDKCSCEAAQRAGNRASASELEASGLRRSFSYKSRFDPLGVPELNFRREEFEQHNEGDMALYREARAIFEIRVRMVERRVGKRFSKCPTFR